MKTNIFHDQLVKKIQQFGHEAREHRQIYKRLLQLLPDRYQEINQRHRSQGASPAIATRSANVSEELLAYIEEIVSFCGSSYEARIQYETHMMLIDARRTLRSSKMVQKTR